MSDPIRVEYKASAVAGLRVERSSDHLIVTWPTLPTSSDLVPTIAFCTAGLCIVFIGLLVSIELLHGSTYHRQVDPALLSAAIGLIVGVSCVAISVSSIEIYGDSRGSRWS